MNEDNQTKPPPYLSYTTFKNFLASLKNGVIPARIDKSLMVGQSGATQSYLMASLRFFNLLDGSDLPKSELKALVTTEGEERQKIWNPIFERGYEPIIGDLNLETATVGMLHEKFAAQNLAHETVKKCHSFFAAAAKDAGVPLSPQLEPNTRGSGRKGGRRKPTIKDTSEPDKDDENTTHDSQTAILRLDGSGTRSFKITAPAAVSKTELERIQKWLSFQLIVSEED